MPWQTITATTTHEGFFAAAVPLGDCRYGAALRFGQHWDWVELESIQAMPLADFLTNDHLAPRRATVREGVTEGIEMVTPRPLRYDEKAGFLMVGPPPPPMMLAVVFRPLAER